MRQIIVMAGADGRATGGYGGHGFVILPGVGLSSITQAIPGSFPIYARPRNQGRIDVVNSCAVFTDHPFDQLDLEGCQQYDSFQIISLEKGESFQLAGAKARFISTVLSPVNLGTVAASGAGQFLVGTSAIEHQLLLSGLSSDMVITLYCKSKEGRWYQFDQQVSDGSQMMVLTRKLPGVAFFAQYTSESGASAPSLEVNAVTEVG